MDEWRWSGYYCIIGWSRWSDSAACSRKSHVFTMPVDWCLYAVMLATLLQIWVPTRDKIMTLQTTVGIMTSVHGAVLCIHVVQSKNRLSSINGVVSWTFVWHSPKFESLLNVKMQYDNFQYFTSTTIVVFGHSISRKRFIYRKCRQCQRNQAALTLRRWLGQCVLHLCYHTLCNTDRFLVYL